MGIQTQTPATRRLEGDDDYAKEFIEAHEGEFIYDNGQEQFHQLRDGVFDPVHPNIIRELLADLGEGLSGKFTHDELKKFKSTQTKNGLLQAIQIFIDVDGKDFDRDDLILGVQNGVVDLRTGILTTKPSSIGRNVALLLTIKMQIVHCSRSSYLKSWAAIRSCLVI
jgi:hypothetical protein